METERHVQYYTKKSRISYRMSTYYANIIHYDYVIRVLLSILYNNFNNRLFYQFYFQWRRVANRSTR